MSDNCEHSNPLKHQGTSQAGRFLQALDPANVELHGLSTAQWLRFAREYARLISYNPVDDPDKTNSDWQDFFAAEDEIDSLLQRYGDGDTEPHLALFISFLKLLAFPQQSLNRLPKRHLDFYYREVLKLKKQPYSPDRVHVLFELAQNANQELVDQDVYLKAGKDSAGNRLNYKTTRPLVVNAAKVAALRSVFVDEDGVLRYAPVANSADGKGADFEDDQSWSALGDAAWPEAELSFYIASPLLHLKEGTRTIVLDFSLEDSSKLSGLLATNIEAQLTGEKDWLDPLAVTFDGGSKTSWNITLDPEMDAVVAYDEAVHQAAIDTDQPVIKIRFKNPAYYQSLKDAKMETLELGVSVSGVESLELQNELGNLDPTKPFMPFGSRPKVGSKLSIVYPEMYGKPITNFELSMMWLNLPANFSDHYEHYQDSINSQRQSYSSNLDAIIGYSSFAFYQYDFLTGMYSGGGSGNGTTGDTDTMREDFKANISSPYNPDPETMELFSNRPQVSVDVSTAEGGITVGRGEIEMILTESFYHDLYPELYLNAVLEAQKENDGSHTAEAFADAIDDITAAATGANGGGDDPEGIDLPNEPYTPLLDQLTLNYTAVDMVVLEAVEVAESRTVMFHHHPFGTTQLDAAGNTLLPDYKQKELYVGLEDIKPGSNISLLFQVAEGSENPLHSTFTETESPEWAVLADNNSWLTIADRDFAFNDTNNFLRSGIVELPVPQEATRDNTLIGDDLHWLRVRLNKPADAVCRFIDVHAQATEAIFDNQDNTTDHLNEGLPPETIGKLVNPRAKLKSVAQPYDSFGGKPAESDPAFYRRISERLRHKNRALSIWDYEHLILQAFPALYKVKCINHAHWNGHELDQLSPGNVTLVLIPKITEKSNADFRLKPMVSRDFKDQVEAFINSLHSPHATVKTADAIYEAVQFIFDIEFNKGLDFNFYQNRTIEDLTRLMAPWVFESDAAIRFGGMFTEYQIVNFLENLEYVHYVQNFRMFHTPLNSESPEKKRVVEPSNPMAILVPANTHTINPATTCV